MDILAILGFVIYVLFKVAKGLGKAGDTEEERLPVPRRRKYIPPRQDTWNDDSWDDDADWKQVPRMKPTAAETRAAPAGTKTAKQRTSIMPNQGQVMRPELTGSVTAGRDGTTGQNTGRNPSYREPAVPAPVPAVAEEQPNPWLKLLTGDNLVQGIVLSEILQPPRAMRPFSTRRRR
ncbi:MAG: hypothetical protein M0021_10155 [Clostridia bacterium]|nr:hypothetical protein [Clostridia bacterium]